MGKISFILFIFALKASAFDPLLFEEGISAISEGVQSQLETPVCGEEVSNTYNCSRYLKRYRRIKEKLTSLSTDPVAHGFSTLELTDAGDDKYFNLKARLNSRLSRLVQKCQKKRSRKCYGKGRSIEREVLDKKFENWKKDKLYRMPYPAVHCFQRAYLLSQNLKKEGYDVSLLQIGSSPTLIAKPLDKEDNLLDVDPIDYNGIHWVVSIKSKDKSGKEQKLLLDPQFATRPMKYEEYFAKTIGQECRPSNFYEGTEFMTTRIKTWKCGYKEFNPARLWRVRVSLDEKPKDDIYGVSGESILKNESSCGFDYAKDAEKNIKGAIEAYSFKVEDVGTKQVNDSKKDILSAYRQDYAWIKRNKEILTSNIEQTKQRIKAGRGGDETVIKNEKEFLRKYKKELKLVNKLIRNYDKTIENIEKTLGVAQ